MILAIRIKAPERGDDQGRNKKPMDSWIHTETRGAPPIQAGGRTLTLFSQALTVKIPRIPVGLVWNRPASVLVSGEGGQEEILPVKDVTRQVIWSLWGAALVTAILAGIARRKHWI